MALIRVKSRHCPLVVIPDTFTLGSQSITPTPLSVIAVYSRQPSRGVISVKIKWGARFPPEAVSHLSGSRTPQSGVSHSQRETPSVSDTQGESDGPQRSLRLPQSLFHKLKACNHWEDNCFLNLLIYTVSANTQHWNVGKSGDKCVAPLIWETAAEYPCIQNGDIIHSGLWLRDMHEKIGKDCI